MKINNIENNNEEKFSFVLDFLYEEEGRIENLKRLEVNTFDIHSIEEYKKLWKLWVDSGGYDFFLKNFSRPCQGFTVGCEGGTQISFNYTGDICDEKEYFLGIKELKGW